MAMFYPNQVQNQGKLQVQLHNGHESSAKEIPINSAHNTVININIDSNTFGR